MAHVEGDVEVRVVDPHRAALTERHERQPLAIAGDQVQPREDVRDQLVVGRGAPFEDRGAGDMHVGGAVLKVQKRAVKAGQAVGIGRHRKVSVRICSVTSVTQILNRGCQLWASLNNRLAESFLPGAGTSGGPIAGRRELPGRGESIA